MANKPIKSLTIPGLSDTYVNNPESIASQFDSTVSYAIGDYAYYNNKLYRFTAAHSGAWAAADVTETTIGDDIVTDVQINGTSITQNGVANVPLAGISTLGVIKIGNGLILNSSNQIQVDPAGDSQIKAGTASNAFITPYRQEKSVFYGLAKAAGDSTQSQSSNAVGVYTDAAKKAIRKMLGIPNMTSELIYETTVAENTERVDIETDTNGLPFKLRACKVYVKLTASTTGSTDYVTTQYVATKMDDIDITNSFPTLKMQNASNSLLTYEFESFPGGMYFVRGYASSNFNSSSNGGISMNQDHLIKFIKKITVKQYTATSTLIPAGTIIKIYGIRYDD